MWIGSLCPPGVLSLSVPVACRDDLAMMKTTTRCKDVKVTIPGQPCMAHDLDDISVIYAAAGIAGTSEVF